MKLCHYVKNYVMMSNLKISCYRALSHIHVWILYNFISNNLMYNILESGLSVVKNQGHQGINYGLSV